MNKSRTLNMPQKKNDIYTLTLTALMTGVTCIVAPMSIPIGPVPISLTSLAICISLYLLGWKNGSISYILYIFIGILGLPVFSGFTGGIGKLAGPTGGYIIGFIPMAILVGFIIEKTRNRLVHIVGMVLGMIICYIVGMAWFCIVMDSTIGTAVTLCVFPFIPGDIIKILAAVSIGPLIKNRVQKMMLFS